MRTRTSTVLAGLVGLAVTLSMAVPAAQAAPARAAGSTATVQDRLVLEPTDFGYRGSIQAELTYHGVEPGRARYVITEPVPGSYENLEWGVTCYSGGERLPDRRIRVECDVPGGEFQPGEHRAFTIDFQVLTTIQPYAMKAKNGRLAVTVNGKVVTDETFQSRFRSSTGSLRDPVTYVRDQQPDAGITAGDLTLVRQPDGTFEGRLPLTVRYDGDAPHNALHLFTQNLPAGIYEMHTVPTDDCGHFCVPGGQFMEGEVRNFDLVFTGSADTRLGDLGEAGIEVQTDPWTPQALPDADPSDNVTTFSITAVEAG
ncbi:hypothetical protein I0C86_20975 [Plantactinospora sp. S1510]|uniref:Uncharacterized protein n=1 Tax=Plantactinospora alkalitolerans TaxID=2789879 RepID=A0ABS0GZB4_9ACTN|nr:hypothetical protein [Plantactinospora alkalitolerans]MBF9131416.1 hypothetical protein [Plantactinospora alkalitolerans]